VTGIHSRYGALALLLIIITMTMPLAAIQAQTLLTASQTIPAVGTIGGSLTWLKTNGNLIETTNGAIFNFEGVAIAILDWGWTNPNYYMDGNWNESLIAFLAQCGGNSIRLDINCYQFNDAYFAEIDQVVNWCTQNNVRVILDIHDGDPNTISTTWPNDMLTIMQNPNAPLNTIISPYPGDAPYPNVSWIGLLDFYVTRYENNPTVSMINIMNEPMEAQSSNDTYLFNIWRNAANLAVESIQAINPNILIGVYGMNWGKTMTDWVSQPLPENNIVYCYDIHLAYDVGWEAYANDYMAGNYTLAKQEWIAYLTQNDVLALSAEYPVLAIEWGSQQYNGYNATLEPAYLQWTEDTFQIFAQYKIGQEYWAFNPVDPITIVGNDGDLLDYPNWANGTLVLDATGQIWEQYCEG